ncbi:MAG TPA: lamin tail domain-containing protein [Kofleriaceae bacterium]
MKLQLVVVLGIVACGQGPAPEQQVEQQVFDCADPAQRFTCEAPANPDKRFICHATGKGYNKLSVGLDSDHQPGVPHEPGRPADQAPGASANDVGGGPGLDCDCTPRICEGTCTGSEPGESCDDEDPCTGDGTCGGDACEPGPASCVPGTPVDSCTVLSGTCAPESGACGTMPLPAGTPCGELEICDGNGGCVPAPRVVANEVESNGGVPGDWIELYNDSPTAADVSGWRLLDNDNTHVYVLPAGTTIAGGAYFVVDESSLGFGLGGADAVRVQDASGAAIDSHAWTAHAVTSYGRCPDGSGAFQTTTVTTKGAANDCRPAVKINEIESSGGTPGDWTELFNAGPLAIDLSGWIFKDADDTHAYAIPTGTVIAPGGYVILDEAAFGFGLGAADSARLFDLQGAQVDAHMWTTHAITSYGRCPDGSGAFQTTTVTTKGGANNCAAAVKINEIESSGGTPGDWAELVNTGPLAVDISGWIFKDADDTHAYAIPSGTVIAPNGYVVLDEAAFGFGLGAADSARLFDPSGAQIDAYAWTTHAAITYGRCPNGTGDFATTAAATKGATNNCSSGPPPASPWPGSASVTVADAGNVFGTNLSGIVRDGSVMWAVRNGPSTLFRLVWNGSIWVPDLARTLRYGDLGGEPDAEDVTRAEPGSSAIYVATERDNLAGTVSRPSILRFDLDQASGDLIATHEWNVASALPVVGANTGLEAITWIPDSYLTANGFFDESRGAVYQPALYPDHGSGLFFVGVEANGAIYAFALDHATGTFTRIATIASGDVTAKALVFDREVGYLWTYCGAPCGGQAAVLTIDTTPGSPTLGRFKVRRQFARPTGMPNIANEGIAIEPESACVAGQKGFWWTDDGQTDGFALRGGTIPCGAFIP